MRLSLRRFGAVGAGSVLLATGATTGATSQAQTFTNGVVTGAGSFIGVGITPTVPLHVLGTLGEIRAADVNANNTSKVARFTVTHYQNAEEPVGGFIASSTSTANNILLGGGSGLVNAATFIGFYAAANTTTTTGTLSASITTTGFGAGGGHTPSAAIHAAASTAARASFCAPPGTAPTTPVAGDIWNDGALSFYNADSTTNAVVNHLRLRRNSTGTAASGFGLGIIAELESSTTDAQSAGRLSFEWVTATHASRASRGKLTAFYTTTEQAAMTWDGDTGGLRLGFYDVTPVARQVLATGAGATVDNVITALQNLGLVKQS